MEIRPFQSDRFALNIAQGDIFTEAGDLLFVGRPKGLVHASKYGLDKDELWEPADTLQVPFRKVFQYNGNDVPWRNVVSYPYHPRTRAHLPNRPSDMTAIHYYKLRADLELLLLGGLNRSRIQGDARIGVVPFSWRRPELVAHAMIEAIAGLFACMRHARQPTSLVVVVRSLDEPYEIIRALEPNAFPWKQSQRSVWFPF